MVALLRDTTSFFLQFFGHTEAYQLVLLIPKAPPRRILVAMKDDYFSGPRGVNLLCVCVARVSVVMVCVSGAVDLMKAATEPGLYIS